MNAGCSVASITIDELVQAYESARTNDPHVDVAAFFPPADETGRAMAIVELLRVDLEYAWGDGIRDRFEQQVARFGPLLSLEQLAEVAYEDFRLRHSAGESIPQSAYASRYAISTADWPELPVGEQRPSDSVHADPPSWLEELSRTSPALAQELSAAANDMPKSGQQLGEFELVGELGRGAFGRVFLARQGSLAKRFVALKVTPRRSDESQHLAQLQHTNIVPIYSLHEFDSLQAICMPYLGANTLADLLRTCRREPSLPLSGKVFVTTIRGRNSATVEQDQQPAVADETSSQELFREQATNLRLERLGRMSYLEAVVWLFVRLADGLGYAHEQGIVHRDLKPANVLLGDDGQPLLLDFHVAIGATWPASATVLAGGTLPYMAPESLQALRYEEIAGDFRSDIFSLGVMLFELLTGELPFPVRRGAVESIVPQMLEDRRAPLKSPRLINRAVSPALAAITLRCLAEQPADRYTSAHELQEDLQRHLEHRPLRYAPDRSPVERIKKWTQRHPRLSSATSVVSFSLVILAALAGSWIARGNQLATARAREALQTFCDHAEQVAAVLDIPDVDEQALNQAVAEAQQTLDTYAISHNPTWQQRELVARLNEKDRNRLVREVASLLYLLSAGQAQQAMRVASVSERNQLLETALQSNKLIELVHAHGTLPQAAVLQRTRLQSALSGEAIASSACGIEVETANEFEDRYLLAVELTQRRHWSESAELLEQLIRERPSDYKLWLGQGICRLELGNFAEADGCFSTAIAMRPELFLGYFYRATCRIKLKQWQAAGDDCSAALVRRPQAPSPYINRAIARQGQGKTEAAIADLTQAIELGTTETRVYFLRSKWKQSLGDKSGAAADQQEGLRRAPRDELSWIARAMARFNNDPQGAVADCEEALRLNPASWLALQNLAFLQGEKLAHPREAIAMLDRLARVSSNQAEVLASRGVYHARAREREASIRDAEAALKINSDALTNYRVACIFSLTSESEPLDVTRALVALAAALLKQPSLGSLAERDPDLKLLREEKQFRELVAAARRLLLPVAGATAN